MKQTISKKLLILMTCAALSVMIGCGRPATDKVTVQGELTVKDGGKAPDIVFSGNWCCGKCSGGGASPLQCSGCSSGACKASSQATVNVSCTGNSTDDKGVVTCF